MGDVTRLPGSGCRFHVGGRCLYEEMLNPGYTQEWRCRVLARWETAYDEFLVRAELFGLEQSAVPDLWERQFERVARQAFDCDTYSYCPGAEPPACLHVLDGMCRLALPECRGRCRHYQPETELDNTSE